MVVKELEGEQEIEDKDFELLPEGEENIRKLDFESVLMRQIDRIARYGTEGFIDNFGNGIQIFEALMQNMKNDKINANLEAIDKKFREQIQDLTMTESSDGLNDDQGRQEKQRMAIQYETMRQLDKLKTLMDTLGKNKKI